MTKKEQLKAPKLRFKGFTDAWEQRKLGELTIRVTRKNKNIESDLPLTISAQDGLIAQDKFFGKKVASKNLQNYLLLRKGEFAYNKSYSNGYPYGSIKRLNKYDYGVISSLYIAFSPKSVNSSFLEQYYDSSKWYKEIYTRATEGARNHGLLNIAPADFFDSNILVPTSSLEQEKIGRFIEKVNHTINLHEEKLAQLQQLKKGLLQKMFADNNQQVPVLRFNGFDDAWEQRKLGEVLTERSERSSEGDLISVTINSGVVKASFLDKKDNSSSDKSNYKVVKRNDIAYNSMRMWQGASGFSPYDGILSPAYTVLIPTKEVDSKFISYLFKKDKMLQEFQRYSQGLTSDTWNLKYPMLKNIPAILPGVAEQVKIRSVLGQLDSLIAPHQRKLDTLKKVKKYLLQNLFI